MTEEEYLLAKKQIKIEWKQLILHGELQDYDIANTGRIRVHSTGVECKLSKAYGTYNRYEFAHIKLNDGKIMNTGIHRLVGIMFIPIPEKYIKKGLNVKELVIDHIDNIRSHNIVSNLQWLTQKENMHKLFNSDKYIHSLRMEKKDVKNICEDLCNNMTIYEISQKYNYTEDVIYDIRYGRTYKDISKKYEFPTRRTKESVVIDICELLSQGLTCAKIATILNVNKSIAEKILAGITWTEISKNYTFPNKKMTKNNKDTYDKIVKICEMLQDGKSPSKVAKELNISKSTVQHIANRETHQDISKDYVFNYNKCKISDETIEKTCELIADGKMILKDIAKETGVSYSFVKSIKAKKYRTDISCKYF